MANDKQQQRPEPVVRASKRITREQAEKIVAQNRVAAELLAPHDGRVTPDKSNVKK